MKLPDFLISPELLRLKGAMGIPRHKLGKLRAIEVRRDGVTKSEGEVLDKEGLEVDKDDVIALPDGTLSYKDRRVLLYIRDVAQYGGNFSDPRFHFADCSTLRQMRNNLRFGRFVIASREDGLFQLHYVESRRKQDKRLDVCQNCLDRLSYKGFQLGMRADVRRAAVQGFSAKEFFDRYPKTLHGFVPVHTDRTAPTNDYSRDFSQISRAYREKKNWICETCGIRLQKQIMQRYLHVHHINGQKNENDDSNLKAVCVQCHATEPLHGHISATIAYREFEATWQRWRRTGVDL